MTLVKTSLLNGVAVAVKVLSALALNKILAIYVGVSGYAIIGQFQTFVTALAAVASGAVNIGVTKYTAEYFDEPAKQVAIWKTAGAISLIGSIVIGCGVIVFRSPLSEMLLANGGYSEVFIWLGLSLFFLALNALLLAILNGKKEIVRYVVANIFGTIFGMGLTALLAMWYGLYGALVALAIYQSAALVVTLSLCWRCEWFFARNLMGIIDNDALKGLSKFTAMALVPVICASTSQILIRNYIGETYSWVDASYWEAMIRISGINLMIVTAPMAVYLLPRLAEIRSKHELLHEVIRGYRFILPIALAMAVMIYLLREWIIVTLFSGEFSSMTNLFGWQMAGDVAKAGSFLMAYVMIARGLTIQYVATEFIFSVSWVLLVWVCSVGFGVRGAQMGYFLSYSFCWLIQSVLLYRWYRAENSSFSR